MANVQLAASGTRRSPRVLSSANQRRGARRARPLTPVFAIIRYTLRRNRNDQRPSMARLHARAAQTFPTLDTPDMEPKKIIIPDGLRFAELELEREPVTKNLLYRPEPLAALFVANSMELNGIFNNEDIVAWVISQWYLEHRTAGGEKVPVAEEILKEVASLQSKKRCSILRS